MIKRFTSAMHYKEIDMGGAYRSIASEHRLHPGGCPHHLATSPRTYQSHRYKWEEEVWRKEGWEENRVMGEGLEGESLEGFV